MDEDRFFTPETKHEKSVKQEKKIAKETKGRRSLVSGALVRQKGDVLIDKKICIEAKRTDKAQIILKKSWLKKLFADSQFKIPAMHIQIQDESWYLIREQEFKLLLEIREAYEQGATI